MTPSTRLRCRRCSPLRLPAWFRSARSRRRCHCCSIAKCICVSSFFQVLLFYAFIGLTLSIAQGFLVRRLAPRVGEVRLILQAASRRCSVSRCSFGPVSRPSGLLMVASAVEVTGFALMTPSLQSLVSRRSDPAKQGGILGVSQSTSSLARVVGPLIAMPLFFRQAPLPYWAALAIMLVRDGDLCAVCSERPGLRHGANGTGSPAGSDGVAATARARPTSRATFAWPTRVLAPPRRRLPPRPPGRPRSSAASSG